MSIARHLFFLTLVVVLFFCDTAYAHRPYLRKEGTIQGPAGPIILEKLFGDGVISVNRNSFQLRAADGTPLAYTATAPHIAVYCPSIDNCWAFTYPNNTFLEEPWLLDSENIDWKKADKPVFEGEEAKEFDRYISDPASKHFNSFSLGYPEERKDVKGFKRGPSYAAWVRPVFILGSHSVAFSVLFLIAWICFSVPYYHAVRIKKMPSTDSRAMTAISWVFLSFLCIGVMIFVIFSMGFAMALPPLYLISVTIAAIACGRWRLRKKYPDLFAPIAK